MWFGDLVTMKWWDDIWLNEGFATWMSFKPIEAWKPEWHAERGEIQETGGSLSTDSIASVRAIRAKAETPAEIATLFDGIAYGKAASVLRMVEAYVGPEVFRKGTNAYLEKHAYGNATAEDFWNQMAATSEKPVDQVMASFTQQSGAPLITVKTECAVGESHRRLPQEKEDQADHESDAFAGALFRRCGETRFGFAGDLADPRKSSPDRSQGGYVRFAGAATADL